MAGLAIAVAVTLGLALAPPDPPTPGLRARYFATSDWSGEPLLERIDTQLTSETLASVPQLTGRDTFSVEWTGYLIVRRDGIYPFATKSDDGTWLWIGDELVIDNGGAHPVRNVNAQVALARGLYPFKLRYSQYGGDYFLQLGQVDASGIMRHPGPFIASDESYATLRARELWPLAVVALWYAAGLLLAAQALRPLASHVPFFAALAGAWSDGRVRAIAVLGALACAAHIGYGVPAVPTFSADELEPLDTLVSSRSGFRDWNLRWPPLHAYVMAGALQPFAWADALYGLNLRDEVVRAAMFAVSRGLSVILVGLTLVLTFDATRTIAGRISGYFAAALLACSPVVVFFGSRGNLEAAHLFWATVTFWTWLKLVREPTLHWFVAFGGVVGFSIAAKDQAYGYYVAAPFALLAIVLRDRSRGQARRWQAALLDPRLIAVALAALAAMAIGHALPWQWERFVNRIAVMTGPASAPFRMFEPTLRGHLDLFTTTMKSFVWAAGVPLTVAAVTGVVQLVRSGRTRLVLGMLTPLATYYLTFLVVILYVYDRFLIGWLPLAAMCGGTFLASLCDLRSPHAALGRYAVAAFIAVGVLNAVAINVVFFRDPRHDAWTWMQKNIPCGSSVAVMYSGQYVPPLDCFDVWQLNSSIIATMVRTPRFIVLNEAYSHRFMNTPTGGTYLRQLAAGELGYRRVARFESRPPLWAPLYWEPRFRNGREDAETVSDKPLHAIEVWECVEAACRSSSSSAPDDDSH